jgi:hypothetical protein
MTLATCLEARKDGSFPSGDCDQSKQPQEVMQRGVFGIWTTTPNKANMGTTKAKYLRSNKMATFRSLEEIRRIGITTAAGCFRRLLGGLQ